MFSIRLTDRLIRSQQGGFFYPFLANSEASPHNNEEHEMRGNTVRAFDFNILPQGDELWTSAMPGAVNIR